MTREEFQKLDAGDLIRHKSASTALVVTANYGSHVTAVRTQNVTNPDEWDLLSKAYHHPIVVAESPAVLDVDSRGADRASRTIR